MELVVGASEATMKSLLGKLGGLLAQEYALVRGVRGDVQYIYNELATMQAFLVDLSSDPNKPNQRMKDWMKQVRDMAYDCEDCIDDFAHRLPNDSISDVRRCSCIVRIMYEVWTWWPRREIASNIADLKIRAQQIAERRVRYGVDNPSNSNGNNSEARAATFDVAEHQVASRQVIGMEPPVGVTADMKKLEEWVRGSAAEEAVAVLSIIGFGGVGKTTIATALYQKVMHEFECRAWVNVSQNYDKDAVLRSILKQVMPQDRNHKERSIRNGSSEKKNIVALLTKKIKQAMPFRGHKQQAGNGSADEKQIMIEATEGDKFVNKVKEHPKGERGHKQQGSNGNSDEEQIKIEAVEGDELVDEVKEHPKGKRGHKQQGSNESSGEEQIKIEAVECDTIVNEVKEHPKGRRGHKQQGSNGSSDEKQINIEAMEGDKLVNEVKKYLEGKRYLLLIDDIWSAKTWDSIRHCLPHDNNKRSRIIVTSRFQAVGAACSGGTTDLLHTVDFLQAADSKTLFTRSVSECKSSKHSDKEAIELAEICCKICGGLPLAIVTTAGVVACNPSKDSGHWDKVCKSLFPEGVTTLSLDGVKRIIDFCYNDLPGDLKTCALYLSIFPRGSKISMKRLTRRLIAEGFVSEKQGLAEEEVAETYFNQLMRRKLIRPLEHNSHGKVKTFQVHDMFLQYLVSKSSEENFITVVGGHWMMPPPSNKVRRLSMQSSGSKHENMTKNMNLCQVRSATVFGSLKQLPFDSFNKGIIQVLDVEGWKGLKERHVKNHICKMLMLKYLSLRRTEIAKLPSKIKKLEYLEILDVRETHVQELPKSVGQLKRISTILGGNKNPRKGLRLPQEKNKEVENKEKNKEMENMEKNKEEKNEGMKALRVLSGIEIVGESTAVVDGLHQMTGLKKISIYKLDNIKKDTKTFKQLLSAIEYLCSCGLQTLAINDEGSDFINSLDDMSAPPRYLVALELSGNLERPPKWIPRLDSLSKLTLSMTVLRTDTFELLKNLKSLFSLTFSLSAAKQNQDINGILEKNKSESDGEIFVPAGFPRLKLLRFFAPLVPKLGFGDNSMPALEMIQMRFEAFEGLFGIEILTNLREVRLEVKNQEAGVNESDEAVIQKRKEAAEHLNVNDQATGVKESDEAEIQKRKEATKRKEAAEISNFLVEDLKNKTNERLKVIVDYVVNA